ncbi:hypothetical protein KY290_028018 [Solanum tuberosum]|uniref:Reverse transcriptase Ty1/copia-type domain-containing protein n=1 Tax=Solanum tuberosum TaxID=4113 RepID=A0ABQ7UGP4_SOLTU|nr:hypothetical protein KY285_026998 [Solanum tuberosum]KAH0748786.1 hypothetical protein KY290_028018 [Solanum tuberosum]
METWMSRYMSQPPGFTDPSRPDHVCLLKHSLYGLKQPPRMWNKQLTDALLSLGFMATWTKEGLFLSQHKYVTELLRRAQMDSCSSVTTPISPASKLLLFWWNSVE